MFYPSDALRESLKTGMTCEEIAGSAVEIRTGLDGEWIAIA